MLVLFGSSVKKPEEPLQEAAAFLGPSVRQVIRLKNKYAAKGGAQALARGNREKSRSTL